MYVSLSAIWSNTYQLIKAKFEAGLTSQEKKVALLALAYFACAAIGYFIISYCFYANRKVKVKENDSESKPVDKVKSPLVFHAVVKEEPPLDDLLDEQKIEVKQYEAPKVLDKPVSQEAPLSKPKRTIAQRLEDNDQDARKQQNEEMAKGFKLVDGPVANEWGYYQKPLDVESNTIFGHDVSCANCEGPRSSMEDAHIATQGSFKSQDVTYGFELYGVFDGHGGKGASLFLQDNLLSYLQAELEIHNHDQLTQEGVFKALKHCFKKIDHDYPNRDGSTATVVLVINGKIWVANVGDSRTVLIKDGVAIQASEDAKPGIYQKSIEKLGGLVFGGRVFGQLAVARAVGDKDLIGNKGVCCVSPNPKITCYDDDVEYILLACDGLYDKVSTNELQAAFATMKENTDSTEDMAKRLAFSSLDCGSSDNVTVMVVNRKKKQPSPPSPKLADPSPGMADPNLHNLTTDITKLAMIDTEAYVQEVKDRLKKLNVTDNMNDPILFNKFTKKLDISDIFNQKFLPLTLSDDRLLKSFIK